MKKFAGFGGVGDCFINILKCLNQHCNFKYTHVDRCEPHLRISEELLSTLNINHETVYVGRHQKASIRWERDNEEFYDKVFNLNANEEITDPFILTNERDKKYKICIQVSGGIKEKVKRGYEIKKRPIEDYIKSIYKGERDKIAWVGLDDAFDAPFGLNYSGKTSLKETLDIVLSSEVFIGFNSVLLYWALQNKIPSHCFITNQGESDIRIHNQWNKYLTYIK